MLPYIQMWFRWLDYDKHTRVGQGWALEVFDCVGETFTNRTDFISGKRENSSHQVSIQLALMKCPEIQLFYGPPNVLTRIVSVTDNIDGGVLLRQIVSDSMTFILVLGPYFSIPPPFFSGYLISSTLETASCSDIRNLTQRSQYWGISPMIHRFQEITILQEHSEIDLGVTFKFSADFFSKFLGLFGQSEHKLPGRTCWFLILRHCLIE